MKLLTIFIIIAIIGIFMIGWACNGLYSLLQYKKQLDGLWLKNYNYTEVKTETNSLDNSGEWVCINVDKNMDYSKCVEVASHECGHELFARKCQDKPEICFKLMKELENETN